MTNGAKFDMIQGELNGRRVILLPGHEVIRMPSAGFKTPAPADYTGALSELLPHAGVYVANSSIAKFVVIDVVEQNQEYAIVQAGSTTGLQPYDTIVSDAKNIKEGDSVF